MRVAIISHEFSKSGGQARVNYELVRHCVAEGVEIEVVSERIAHDLLEIGVQWHRIVPSFSKPQMFSNWSFATQADRLIPKLRQRVDLIMGCGFVARASHDISVCHMLHTAFRKSPYFPWRPWIRNKPNGWYQSLYTRTNSSWEKQTYGAVKVVVAVSNKVRTELIDAGLPAAKVRTIHNGVDLDEFRPGSAQREKWNLPTDRPLALFAGGIRTALRNLDSVLKALLLVPNLHLAVAGDTRSSPFPAMSAKLGLGDRVHFLGFRRDVAELMRAADFFVYPSRYEACSLVLLEAISSGLPVITSVTAGGSELLKKSCAWVLDNPHDIASMGQCMRRLVEDNELRRRMSVAARSTAERFPWASMASRYLELFHECAGSASREVTQNRAEALS